MEKSNQRNREEAYGVLNLRRLTCLRRDQNAVAKTETKPLSSREDRDDQKRERRRCSGDCMRRTTDEESENGGCVKTERTQFTLGVSR
ncbi:hypothetical protein IGI04_025636 [Brassica rapa subsp. trilocularis]|uniref:Uncharacterized protein n=1 Tax=Brassica rapa subsp. trilocularis TaxID=1813537 RepID=A0ABQ7KU48_BRACM|nr:hypothetical protein IGI04_025636 [Brassica rapa subsp. trilocularis]